MLSLSFLKKNSLCFVATFFFFTHYVTAANLTISPDTLFVENGKSFVVSFYVNNNETSINAISAQVSYPKDLLRLTSFSKNGSLLQMWSEEPSFSNMVGDAHFEGVILNPGFSAKKGLILTATFTPLARGVATIRITSGNIYANDGKATDVLSLLGSATYTITDVQPPDTVPVKKKSDTGSNQIEISSVTHPREDVWYRSKVVALDLNLPENTNTIQYKISKQNKSATSKVILATSTLSLALESDGEYFFNAKAKQDSLWGQSTVFGLKIDSETPYFLGVSLPYGTSSKKILQKVHLSAKDRLSGISHFDIKLNEGQVQTITADKIGEVDTMLPKALPRNNSLLVVAYDNAGNSKTTTVPFYISPLDQPTITTYTKELKAQDVFNLSAKTYPNAVLLVTLVSVDTTIKKEVISDEAGAVSFSTIIEKPGMYTSFIQILDFDGGESEALNIGQVKVTHSIAWIFSSFRAQTIVFLILVCILILGTSILSSVVTRQIVKKSFENNKDNISISQEASKITSEDSSHT